MAFIHHDGTLNFRVEIAGKANVTENDKILYDKENNKYVRDVVYYKNKENKDCVLFGVSKTPKCDYNKKKNG